MPPGSAPSVRFRLSRSPRAMQFRSESSKRAPQEEGPAEDRPVLYAGCRNTDRRDLPGLGKTAELRCATSAGNSQAATGTARPTQGRWSHRTRSRLLSGDRRTILESAASRETLACNAEFA